MKNIKVGDNLLAFEYLLAMVCKLYYKSSFMIEDYIKLFNIRGEVQTKASEGKRPGRKGKKKRGVPRSMNINLTKNGASSGLEGENNPEVDHEKSSFIINPPIDAGLDILEQLISPIRNDKEYGKR